MTFNKDITPSYEIDGRRKRLVGYIGQITDESGVVLHSCEYSTHGQAENGLNAIVFDLLMDYAERGLVDTVPDAYTLAADAGAFGPQTPTWDINNSEYCPAHQVWFGRMPCPECYIEKRQNREIPLFDDIAHVIDMALGQSHGAASVVAELRRVRARLEQV